MSLMPYYKNDIAKAKQKTVDSLITRRDEIGEHVYEIILETIKETFDELKFGADVNSVTNDLLRLIQTRRKIQ